jgi:hypothetical protein
MYRIVCSAVILNERAYPTHTGPLATTTKIRQNRLWIEITDKADGLLVGEVREDLIYPITLCTLVRGSGECMVASLLLSVTSDQYQKRKVIGKPRIVIGFPYIA